MGGEIYTAIVPASQFTLAEAYHQKYQLRRAPDLMAEFCAIYLGDDDFVSSTAAARVNGYLGGYGTCQGLREQVDSLGLSEAGRAKLLRMVCGSRG